MRSTQQLRDLWAPACKGDRGARFEFWSGAPITIDRRLLDAVRALDACLKAWNYRPERHHTGAYVCRKITGGSGYSLHAFLIAIDINWQRNPYGPRLITDMPRPMVDAILAIRTKGGHRVWGWGGNYRKNKDAMHYEAQASPAELATGIDWSTVRGSAVTPLPEEEDEMHQTFSVDPGEAVTIDLEPLGGWTGVKEAAVVVTGVDETNPIYVALHGHGGQQGQHNISPAKWVRVGFGQGKHHTVAYVRNDGKHPIGVTYVGRK